MCTVVTTAPLDGDPASTGSRRRWGRITGDDGIANMSGMRRLRDAEGGWSGWSVLGTDGALRGRRCLIAKSQGLERVVDCTRMPDGGASSRGAVIARACDSSAERRGDRVMAGGARCRDVPSTAPKLAWVHVLEMEMGRFMIIARK